MRRGSVSRSQSLEIAAVRGGEAQVTKDYWEVGDYSESSPFTHHTPRFHILLCCHLPRSRFGSSSIGRSVSSSLHTPLQVQVQVRLQNMATDLASLLTSSKALTAHLSKPDLPSVQLSLDQVEAQSRRLVSRYSTAANDTDRAYVAYSLIQICAG